MSSVLSNANDIYLFEIYQPLVGYAEFSRVRKRNNNVPAKDVVDEITKGNYKSWSDVTDNHKLYALDLKLKSDTKALLFFVIYNRNSGNKTIFGERAVQEVDISRNVKKPIFRNPVSYTINSGIISVCSFEIDIPDVLKSIGTGGAGHDISRLPIMFDFVDTDGISPVFKKPHGASFGKEGDGSILDHGGIHPPSAVSMIIVE